jgi:copper(I)-binding protein
MNAVRGAIVLALGALCLACQPRMREPIEITAAHSMSTPPGATVGGAYMTIRSRDGDVLLSATTPVAGRVEMHVTEPHDGMMSMRPLTEAEVKPGAEFVFAPGAAHFMLIDLRAPLEAGTTFPITLQFEKAGNVTTNVRVLAPGEGQNQ